MGCTLPGKKCTVDPFPPASRMAGMGDERTAAADLHRYPLAAGGIGRRTMARESHNAAATVSRYPCKHDAVVDRNAQGGFSPHGRLLRQNAVPVRRRYQLVD